MAADLTFGNTGHLHPLFFTKQMTMASLLTSGQRQPLRHSIDAILHTSNTSERTMTSSSKPTLPHIETLRRCSDTGRFSFVLPSSPTSKAFENDAESLKCSMGDVIADDDIRACASLHSSLGSSCSEAEEDMEEEEVDVVDEDSECPDSSTDADLNDNGKENLHLQQLVPSPDSPVPEPTTEHVSNNAKSQKARKGYQSLNAAKQDSYDIKTKEGAKSAFKPIVRPWLVDEGNSPPSAFERRGGKDVSRHTPAGAGSSVGVGGKCGAGNSVGVGGKCGGAGNSVGVGGKCGGAGNSVGVGGKCGGAKAVGSGPRPVDAITMLRTHGSAFRVPQGRGPTFRPEVTRHHVTTLSPSMLTTTTAPCSRHQPGQPLPSTLVSWFSWLRAGGGGGGGLQFGSSHPLPHPHSIPPFQTGSHRGVLPPPASRVPVAAPPHAPHPHTPPRYNCEACGKSYSTFGGLSKHKQFHCAAQVKKDFRCKYCEKSYTSLGALKMHIRTHTLPCKCTVCGKAFSRPWLLQGHVRTHTGEKPFSCQHCQRAFADRSNLRAHLQTHSHVKKYSCQHCHKTFSRMSLLVKHRDSSCPALQQ